jgi:ankyrin repeat protein
MIDLLVRHGANADAPDRDGHTPLMEAAFFSRADLVEQLIQCGVDVNHAAKNGWTALHWSACIDDSRSVTILLSAGADPGLRDDDGKTPLDVAGQYEANDAAQIDLNAAAVARHRS